MEKRFFPNQCSHCKGSNGVQEEYEYCVRREVRRGGRKCTDKCTDMGVRKSVAHPGIAPNASLVVFSAFGAGQGSDSGIGFWGRIQGSDPRIGLWDLSQESDSGIGF